MRNILALIQRFYTFLLFLVLQGLALFLLFSNNNFHRSEFVEHSSDWVGSIYGKRDQLSRYLRLGEINDQLALENAILRSRLPENFDAVDTSRFEYIDSLGQQNYTYRPARVINATVNRERNYLTLDKGRSEGLSNGQGVISDGSIVGVITSVSDHYAVVMPILHSKFQGSVRLKKTGDYGLLIWDGGDPAIADVKDIPKQTPVMQGDTVITSGYANFPGNLMVGIVETVEETDDSYHKVRIRLSTNFRRLNYVQVVSDPHRAEQDSLEKVVLDGDGPHTN